MRSITAIAVEKYSQCPSRTLEEIRERINALGFEVECSRNRLQVPSMAPQPYLIIRARLVIQSSAGGNAGSRLRELQMTGDGPPVNLALLKRFCELSSSGSSIS